MVPSVALRLEAGGIDELWVIEDCFYTAGPSLAAAALTVTETLHVGIGILPAVVRHPAITAMEIATLDELGSGRFTAGIGHGVQSWMDQIGLRERSPLTALEETFTIVSQLLSGDEVSFEGETVRCDSVRLDRAPEQRIDLLAGVRGPRSMELAGRIADGVILAGPASPAYVDWARQRANRPTDWRVVAFAPWLVIEDGPRAQSLMAPWLASELEDPNIGMTQLSFFDDLRDRHADGGAPALADLPAAWWHEIGPIGTPQDALTYLDGMEGAGTDVVSVFPAPMVPEAMADIDTLISIARRR